MSSLTHNACLLCDDEKNEAIGKSINRRIKGQKQRKNLIKATAEIEKMKRHFFCLFKVLRKSPDVNDIMTLLSENACGQK